MAHARRAVALGPNESQPHRVLAAIIWLNILFHRGAVSIDYYMGSLTRQRASSPKPPPELVAEFRAELTKAIDLAEARLKLQPRDLQARFDVGTAYALQASYTASVDGSMTAAFKSARRAYDAQEEVLTRDPTRVDAGLVVGLYRYLISALALPTRLFAYVVGFGGGKERGIQMLEEATRDPRTRVDAKTALMLVYSREARHGDVVRIAQELRTEFPRNRLFVLEEGAAAIRAGRAAEAEVTLTRRPEPARRRYPAEKSGRTRVLALQTRPRPRHSAATRQGAIRSAQRAGVGADRLGERPHPPGARENRRSRGPPAGSAR